MRSFFPKDLTRKAKAWRRNEPAHSVKVGGNKKQNKTKNQKPKRQHTLKLARSTQRFQFRAIDREPILHAKCACKKWMISIMNSVDRYLIARKTRRNSKKNKKKKIKGTNNHNAWQTRTRVQYTKGTKGDTNKYREKHEIRKEKRASCTTMAPAIIGRKPILRDISCLQTRYEKKLRKKHLKMTGEWANKCTC